MEKPRLEDLLTTAHIGGLIGTSRQWAHYIATTAEAFPEPIGNLGHYVVWWRPEIVEWLEQNPDGWRRIVQRHPWPPRRPCGESIAGT